MDHGRHDIQVRRLKIVLLVASLASLALLVLAAFEENLAGEWRGYQKSYRLAAIAGATDDRTRSAAEAMEVGFKQLFLPDLKRIDRCQTCHVGTDDPRMIDAELPLRKHSGDFLEHHPVEKFGCTICHDGQGRAVHRMDAHGETPHWPSPLLRGNRVYTSCGRCHYENDLYGAESDLYVAGEPGMRGSPRRAPLEVHELASWARGGESIARGKQLVLEKGCLGCHTYRGRGGTLGPDISYVGDKGPHDFDFRHVHGARTVENWLFEHFKRPSLVTPGTLMPDLRLTDQQATDLTHYMLSLHRKEMPAAYTPVPPRRGRGLKTEPVSGRQLYAMYCSACHGRNGRGSTVRDPSSPRSIDAPPELMVPSLNHPDTLAVASDDYLGHLIARGRPGTNMIGWSTDSDGGLLTSEVDRLVDFIRSWEPPRPDGASTASSIGEPRVGEALYVANCSACHGAAGQGGIGPSLNAAGFLGIANDEFLAETIVEGRPNTAMPSFRQFESRQISDLIAFLRSWHLQRNSRESVLRLVAAAKEPGEPAVSARIGETLYRTHCVMCHGPAGEGDLAPSLATQEFLTIAGDEYLYETLASGRPGTGMPAWRHLSDADVASLIVFMRSRQTAPSRMLSPARIDGDWDAGRFLYAGVCASCHGRHAEGGTGPQLNNPVFLRCATDAMLREWIAHGKAGTAMQGFLKGGQGMVELKAGQIANIVSYLRSLERVEPGDRVWAAKNPNGRPELGEVWYAVACAPCHGVNGEGESGPSLSNPAFLRAASDGFLMATMAMGRDGTEMRPVKKSPQSILSLSSDQVNDLVAYLRSWETSPPDVDIPHRFVIPWDLARGGRLYESNCAGCHGVHGKAELREPGVSAWAPQLNNPGFLAAATDGFLQATIVRGRMGTAMRPFGRGTQGLVDLSMQDIDDIVAYIRQWASMPGSMSPMTIPAERSTSVVQSNADTETTDKLDVDAARATGYAGSRAMTTAVQHGQGG